MIGIALLAWTAAFASPWTEQTQTALDHCKPQDERAAIRCLRENLPRPVRQLVTSQPQPEFWDDTFNGLFLYPIISAFRLDEENGPIVLEYGRRGYPSANLYKRAERILESYWLAEKGCSYSDKDRASIETVKEEAQLSYIEFELEMREQGIDGHMTPALTPRLEVSCDRWEPASE